MTLHCDSVAERTALGEPLGELAEHVAGCERCQRVVEMPGKLGATKHAIDPGLGFSARMTVGAQQRIVARRRQRLATGLAASVAASALGVVLVTRSPAEEPVTALPLPPPPALKLDKEPADTPLEDDDLKALVGLADTKRSSKVSANWSRIEKRLAAYQKLVAEGDAE